MRIGILQPKAGYNKEENLKKAADMVKRATEQGADIVALPEMFCCPMEHKYFKEFAEEKGGMMYTALMNMARDNGVYLVGGSVPEIRKNQREGSFSEALENSEEIQKNTDKIEREMCLYNTSWTFAPDGKEIHSHSKRKLFDITLPNGKEFKESDTFTAGEHAPAVFETPFGKIGLAICFEIRFAEDFYAMERQGAEVVFIPADFSVPTGEAHWELLFRARALDTQSFFVGVSGARNRESKFKSYAHSIVTDPWGDVVWQAGEEECIKVIEIDFEKMKKVRREIPVSNNR